MLRKFIKLSVFTILVCFTTVEIVSAKNAYTTRSKAPSSESSEDTCSKADLRAIKTFNIKAKSKVADYKKLVAKKDDVISDRDAKEFTEDMERIIKFYRSEEFEEMAKIYDACDIVVPRPIAPQLFWVPEDKRSNHPSL